MADSLVTLYQAEWCPFSSAVREVLTELGIDAVVRQVEPWPEQRERLRELAGTDQIPVMQTEDGQILRGTREIFAHLREREPWRFAAAHRRRFADHRDARESDAAGKLLEYFRDAGELESREPRATPPGDAEVVNVPEAHRYELLLDGERIGELAYRQRKRPDRVHAHQCEPCLRGPRARQPPRRGRAGRCAPARGWPSSPSVPSSPGTSSNTPNTRTWSRRTTQVAAPTS